MLEALVVILVIAWLLGWLAFPIGGNLIHILLVVALIALIVRLVQPRRTI